MIPALITTAMVAALVTAFTFPKPNSGRNRRRAFLISGPVFFFSIAILIVVSLWRTA
jgi:hypothetical protein